MEFGERVQEAIGAQRRGDLAAAEAAYRGILADQPDQPDALHFLGLLRFQRGEADEAIRLIRQSLDRQPANPSAHTNLGNILKLLDRREEAAEAYIAALELDGGHADALNNLGIMLRAAERYPQAIELLRQAVAVEPKHSDAWHNLGMTLLLSGRKEEAADAFESSLHLTERGRAQTNWLAQVLTALGRTEAALEVFEDYLERNPGDPVATHQLAALRGEAPERASDEYVRRHFDSFSDSFDEVLGLLKYRAPQLVAEAVERRVGDARLADVVDLGCGTGLLGPLIRPRCGRLVGIDLSTGMLRHARKTGAYDYLVTAELVEFLRDVPPIRFDLAVCADTLCYFGSLAPAMQALAGALKPGGALIATVEQLDEAAEDGFRIGSSGRYAHSEAHLRETATSAGLTVSRVEPVTLRLELGNEVRGLLFEIEQPADVRFADAG
ncbi:MAG TPA: tetratricopeptide repeat protein [Paracoccaceae bacterium]|nr:tetratricopeptide repeat protein [Paracoccaceae bacterium]